MSMCKDPELMPEPEGIAKALREPLLKMFPPALLGRLVVIPVLPAVSDDDAGATSSGCSSAASRSASRSNHGIPFDYDDDGGRS